MGGILSIFPRILTRSLIGLSLVLGLNLGWASSAQAQFLGDYEDGIVDIIKCNDRSGFDVGIIEAISSFIRASLFFMGILMGSAVIFAKSGTVIKAIIYVILAFSSVNMLYEVGIKSHMEQARNLSVFAASFERQGSPIDITPINPGDFGDGTDITNPPIGNGGLTLLPPPPPLQGISQGELVGTGEADGDSGAYICNPNNEADGDLTLDDVLDQ